MKKIVFLGLLLIVQILYSQDRVSSKEIYYSSEGIAYKKSDNQIFEGVIQWTKKKGKYIIQEKIFENGRITKSIIYYNIYDRQVISDEIIYNSETLLKEKKISYSIEGETLWITHYDKNEKKSLYEIYENEKLTYSCEYFNGKKHGKEFCTDEKCNEITEYYENGKRIKTNNQ